MRAARESALPQIRIVGPELVICLGLPTFNAIRRACGVKSAKRVEMAIADPFPFEGSRIWCQAHTGGLGRNNREREQVERDWDTMAPASGLQTQSKLPV